MQNYSTVLDQTTWGIHINFEGYLASPPPPPSWLTQLQQQDWQRRGIVLWDADHRIVTHLYAGYALELLEFLQDNSAWKTKGLVVGSPAFQLSNNSANTPSTTVDGVLVMKNQIELTPDQAQTLLEFLSAQEGSLKRISVYDKEGAKHTSVEVVANEMMMLGERRDHNNHVHSGSETALEESNTATNEDEFPF